MRLGRARIFLIVAIAFLALSIAFGVASIYPVSTGAKQSKVIIDDSFHLSPNEIRHQGLGAFQGIENITLTVTGSDVFVKNFSIITYKGFQYNISTSQNITYSFNADADYYEAIFTTNAANTDTLHFQVTVKEPQVTQPLNWIGTPAKIVFLFSLAAAMLLLLENRNTKPSLQADG